MFPWIVFLAIAALASEQRKAPAAKGLTLPAPYKPPALPPGSAPGNGVQAFDTGPIDWWGEYDPQRDPPPWEGLPPPAWWWFMAELGTQYVDLGWLAASQVPAWDGAMVDYARTLVGPGWRVIRQPYDSGNRFMSSHLCAVGCEAGIT